MFAKIQRKTPVLEFLFYKDAGRVAQKETPIQLFSFEFYEIFKKTFFIEQLLWLP